MSLKTCKEPWKRTLTTIKSRTNNPNASNYYLYGAKGIKCLITWQELKALWIRDNAELMEYPSIDRINPKGNYEINNCRYIEFSKNSKKIPKEFCPHGHSYKDRKPRKDKRGHLQQICKTCSIEYSRRNYKNNREKFYQKQKDYRKRHRDTINSNQNRYRKENRELINLKQRQYRNKKKENG